MESSSRPSSPMPEDLGSNTTTTTTNLEERAVDDGHRLAAVEDLARIILELTSIDNTNEEKEEEPVKDMVDEEVPDSVTLQTHNPDDDKKKEGGQDEDMARIILELTDNNNNPHAIDEEDEEDIVDATTEKEKTLVKKENLLDYKLEFIKLAMGKLTDLGTITVGDIAKEANINDEEEGNVAASGVVENENPAVGDLTVEEEEDIQTINLFPVVPETAPPPGTLEEGMIIGGSSGDVAAAAAAPPTPPSEVDNNNNNNNNIVENTATTLEAVPVDDLTPAQIATPVKDETAKRRKQLIFGGCILLIVLIALVVLIATPTTTTTKGDDDNSTIPKESLAPTYSPEQRLELLSGMVLEHFGPIYAMNYYGSGMAGNDSGNITWDNNNITDENAFDNNLLKDSLNNPATAQYQALQWLAVQDGIVADIRQPMLEPGFIDSDEAAAPAAAGANASASSNNNTSTRALRHASRDQFRRRLIGFDRIIQRYSLAVLYYSTTSNVSSWTDSFEFLADEPECDWSGAILCDATNSITHLDLRNNNLLGTVPVELAALTSLEFLDLGNNVLRGTLPPALSQATMLKTVDFGRNKLTGTIPKSLYHGWKEIEMWNLERNGLQGDIQHELGDLTHLKFVHWGRNSLDGTLPPDIWPKLTNMVAFDVGRQDQLTMVITSEIGLWPKLEQLFVQGLKAIGTIPTEIGTLTHMRELGLANNDMSGTLPSELGLLTDMFWCALSINGLTGTVPSEILQITVLEQLYLQNTLLSGDVGFICDAVDEGTFGPLRTLRFDKVEVSGCSCCTCCDF